MLVIDLEMRINRDEYSAIINENKFKHHTLFEYIIKVSLIFIALIWGSILLVKSIYLLPCTSNSSTTSPIYTNNGSLKITLDSIRNQTFQPKFQSLQWIDNESSNIEDKGLYVTYSNDSYTVKSVFDKGFSKQLLKGKYFIYKGMNLTIDSCVASPDLSKILIKSKTVKHWRHSSFGSYYIFDIKTKEFYHIHDNISLAHWSPNSNDIAYVLDNDVYLYSCKLGKTSKRVTYDGDEQVFNGKPDWVYEEEIFGGDTALWWSPNGEYITFLKINETEVSEFPISYYVQDEDIIYPEIRKLKYPKSGTPNPIIKLHIYDMNNDEVSPVNIHDNQILMTEVVWIGNSTILAKITDRSSDVLSVAIINAKDHGSYKILRTNSSESGWWEITHNICYIPANPSKKREYDGYLDIVPINGYNHLVYFYSHDESEPIILTSGEWEVIDGSSIFDSETNRVYFTASKKSSMERHVYYVNLQRPLEVFEITDTSTDGVYSTSFSTGTRFLLLNYLGPGIPYQKIIDLYSRNIDKQIHGNIIGQTLYYLEENKELEMTLKKYSVPRITYQELFLGKDENNQDIMANSFEVLPNDFDPSLQNHYPVFFYTYGGPNSQQVLKTFSLGFNQVIASQLNALVVVVDGRGTGFKGKNFRSIVRDNLGDYEAQDQISAAKLYLQKSYVNSEKISLFGWSYGGYLTLKTLEKDAGEHFKYGISVAPVTDWRLYDSVYTERYMHTPQENPEGYKRSKVHNMTALGCVPRFLLMHGTGDDNVHFQHSLKLLDMLNLKGIENYDIHIFPDSDHSIKFHNANTVIYDKLLSWTRYAFSGEFVKRDI